ncbi:MAG: hypothetical protein ABT940_12685 [Alphaproteobacteria bacterium]
MAGTGVRRGQGETWYLPYWLPPLLLEANGGPFDLAPCGLLLDESSPPIARRVPADPAPESQDWKGTVFLNPQSGEGTIQGWVDRAMRAVHWDKSSRVVVAILPVQLGADWWVSHVRGWASVFLMRGRVRVGSDRVRPPFASAVVLWGEEAPFREVLDRQPKSLVDGLWLPAYRAQSNSAPFLGRLTTRARMKKLYGSYDSFRENLAAWTARVPPEYETVAALTEFPTATPEATDEPGAVAGVRYLTNSLGYITHLKGKPLYKRKRQRKKKTTPMAGEDSTSPSVP